jgi:hypothetical protein
MFDETGSWLSSDTDNILDGWDLQEVVRSGAACGAEPEDLCGCVFFYLRAQYIEFARRLE